MREIFFLYEKLGVQEEKEIYIYFDAINERYDLNRVELNAHYIQDRLKQMLAFLDCF